MKICVIGLGYVGTVVATCLARLGHEVVGVDTLQPKVDLMNAGKPPIVEQDIDAMVEEQVRTERLSATTNLAAAVELTDLSLVCVGTPAHDNGRIDLSHVRRVCEEMGPALRRHPGAPVIAVRSTVLPGTTRDVVIPALESTSGRRAGVDFGLCMNPEFLREGTAVRDFLNPPKTVIGELNRASGDSLAKLYEGLPGPLVRTDIETAEMVKYVDNAWHALKVGFANEIDSICTAVGTDGAKVMDIFCRDHKLNISTSYLKPGFAFGGVCLPKDLRALLAKASSVDVSVPILKAVLPSNQQRLEHGVRAVIDAGRGKVGILGLSFKPGTDDLRESPIVELAERLLGKGFDLRVYDRNVNMAQVSGTNRDYVLHRIPHISRLLVSSVDELLAHAQTIVIGNSAPEFKDVPRSMTEGQVLVDLVRLADTRSIAGVYAGIDG
jgi:GDP-mannose 6-dehydrogenase